MLSFLWVAANKGFAIDSYDDDAVGEMIETDGKQWISKITLDPKIEWSGETCRPLTDRGDAPCGARGMLYREFDQV
jgi:hypothetical protein